MLNALIETDRIELLSGALEAAAVPTDSGRPHEIYRCSTCRVALWSDYGSRPALRFVRVGTLDTPESLPPDIHIFTRSKLPWMQLPEGAPAVPVYYESAELWSSDSLARRRAILAGARPYFPRSSRAE